MKADVIVGDDELDSVEGPVRRGGLSEFAAWIAKLGHAFAGPSDGLEE